jgi:hypothetical protein
LLLGLLLLGSTFAVSATAASPWEPVMPGDTVPFLIPALSDQPGAADDSVIFSGGEISEIDAAGCGGGTHAVQHYVLLDPTGTRSEKVEGIIAMTTRPLQPNTRLGVLTFIATCLVGDVLYVRYEGTVH